MYKNKRVLLIAGGGTLGTHTARELLRLGAWVDVICPEEKVSDHERLRFIRDWVSDALLESLFSQTHYDGIVNFLHYPDEKEYKRVHPLLMQNTDHLIFLSSYRVYANEQHPITETAPRLHEAYAVEGLLSEDTYGVKKALCEDYLMGERKGEHWTIVRPVISFSHIRFDIVLNSKKQVLEKASANEPLLLPESVRHFSAGFDWAGNSGKLIANLLFQDAAFGQAFTVYSGHGMTWGEVAEAYACETGVRVEWVSDEAYIESLSKYWERPRFRIMWYYDRAFSRDVDNTKILSVTGLKKEDFATVREGIRAELKILNWKKEN
jgi:nucleoside-diphosphate-sugar epimerase